MNNPIYFASGDALSVGGDTYVATRPVVIMNGSLLTFRDLREMGFVLHVPPPPPRESRWRRLIAWLRGAP